MPQDKLIVELERRKRASADARKPFERDWWLNLAFYLGHHYVRWGTSNSLERIPFRKGETALDTPRPVANKVMRYVSQLHALAQQHDPEPEVMPPPDDELNGSAPIAQAYLEDLCSPTQADWDSVRGEASLWAVTCGEAWFKWYYDPIRKRPSVVARSPFEVYPDPDAINQSDMRWVIEARFMGLDAIYETFAVRVNPQTADKPDDVKAEIMREMGYASTAQGATVNEMWEIPGRAHPKGRHIVWTSQQVLLNEDFPYEHKRLPFTQVGVIPVAGVLHLHSPVKTLRPLSMELNQYHAQRITIRKNFANPKWFLDADLKASMEESGMPDNSPNQVLWGDSQGGQVVPIILQPASMADNGDGVWIVEEMADAVGLHDVSEGQVPGRVESAKAIELLKQEDATQLQLYRKMLDRSISIGFAQLIELARQYVDNEVVVTTYGQGAVASVQSFMTNSFPKKPLVRVAAVAGLPKSRAARQEQLIAYWNAGIIDDKAQMRRLLELPGEDDITGISFDLTQAQNENHLLANAQGVEANVFDNHQLHRMKHDEWRKSTSYATASDQVRAAFDMHVEDHDVKELEELLKEANRQAQINEIAAIATPPPIVPPDGAPAAGPTTPGVAA